jgi:stage V sporulation protein SpoVS
MCSANLPDKVAIAVDTQMDDGVAGKGTVRALQQAAPNPNVGAAAVATAAYAETGSNVYVLCRSF